VSTTTAAASRAYGFFEIGIRRERVRQLCFSIAPSERNDPRRKDTRGEERRQEGGRIGREEKGKKEMAQWCREKRRDGKGNEFRQQPRENRRERRSGKAKLARQPRPAAHTTASRKSAWTATGQCKCSWFHLASFGGATNFSTLKYGSGALFRQPKPVLMRSDRAELWEAAKRRFVGHAC